MKGGSRFSDGGRRRLLIVEDDELMRTFYKTLFARHKAEFDMELVGRAQVALERIGKDAFDCLILDWDLPGISGIDLLKALRAHAQTRRLAVFMVSGRSRTGDQVLALESGADDYLAKPFDVEVFLARLRNLLNRS